MVPAVNLPPNLCYTLAFDRPEDDTHRCLARLLVTSLLRTGWHGEIVVFKNLPPPVLPRKHPHVHELLLDVNLQAPWQELVAWKYRVRDRLKLSGFGKVLFLDCDCLVLRNIDDILFGTWDIYTAAEPGRLVEAPFNGYLTDREMERLKDRPGLNSGNFGVRASRFVEVMAAWERIDASPPNRPSHNRNQHSWNRLLLDTRLRHRNFATGQIQFPFLHRAVYSDYRKAAIVHAADRSPREKLFLLYGLWAETFGLDRFNDLIVP